MCIDCVLEYGGPATITAEMLTLAALIEQFRDMHEDFICGGPLHIVLDDSNTDDAHIDWCLAEGWHEWLESARTPEAEAAVSEIAARLKAMTEVERVTVVNMDSPGFDTLIDS